MVRVGNGRYVILCSKCSIPVSAAVFNEDEEEILVKHEAVLKLFEDEMMHVQCQESIKTYQAPLEISLTPKFNDEVTKILQNSQPKAKLTTSEVLTYLTELSRLQNVKIDISVSPANPALKAVKTPIVQKPPRSMLSED